jgi:hypothetical protein
LCFELFDKSSAFSGGWSFKYVRGRGIEEFSVLQGDSFPGRVADDTVEARILAGEDIREFLLPIEGVRVNGGI